jgi:hypothetical protein
VREIRYALIGFDGSIDGGVYRPGHASGDDLFGERMTVYRSKAAAGRHRVLVQRVVRVTITEAPARRATATGRRKGKR